MSKKLNRRKYSLILLVGVLALMGVGYAYLSTTVNFNGTAAINSASWNIYLANAQPAAGSVTPTTALAINEAKTEVTYGVTLVNPGDFFEFTVDVKNDGSIDGMIESISSKLNNVEITTLPDYLEYEVSYSSGTDILPNHLLKATTKETYKVRIGFKKDITAAQLPKENQTLNLNFSVSYKQADENGIEVKHPFTGTIYTVNTLVNVVNINQPIPETVVQYNTANEARANFDNRPYYIKHIIEYGAVKESYVEFVVTEEMATSNEGMTAGTYALKGGDKGAAYESNKEVLKTAFGETNCTDTSSSFSCSVSGLNARAGDNGLVSAGETGSDYCNVGGSIVFYCMRNNVGSGGDSELPVI